MRMDGDVSIVALNDSLASRAAMSARRTLSHKCEEKMIGAMM
jgi:hypothetical protein